MRITNAVGYDEPRDTIASDWSNYMLSAFPDSQFVFIPNIEGKVIDYIDKLKIDVIILSGGDDLGVYPIRDHTETIVLKHALKRKIPIIAICRGMQLVHSYFGGKLEPGNSNFVNRHRAITHLIEIDGSTKEVNSYHTNNLVEDSISNGFEIFARCKSDTSIEGFRNKSILAMMWHPERDAKVIKWNKLLIDNFLNNEK